MMDFRGMEEVFQTGGKSPVKGYLGFLFFCLRLCIVPINFSLFLMPYPKTI